LTDSAESKIRIMVIDDHHIVRRGLVALINMESDMAVIAEGADGREAVDLFRQHQPDVVLMDLRLPVLGGADATRSIREEFPAARIIAVTTYDGDEDIYRALQAGACGYILKDMFSEELLSAIRAAHAGRRWVPPVVAERLAARIGSPELTARELEVLELVARANSNREIAVALSISEATVKTHINNILGKLGVTDRSKAVKIALQRGLIHI
jgi:two-component system NarL family response regulator